MALKNYYAILGISPNETPAGIRAAYRNAVRRTHPDHAGPQAAPDFQEIVEAHSVLSDPDRRRRYNEDLNLHQPRRNRSGPVYRSATDSHPRSIFVDMETLPERLLRNFAGFAVPKPEAPNAMSIDVILTPEEAARGGALSIDVPLPDKCGVCAGTGSDWLFPCIYCGGGGTVSRMQPVEVPIPQSIRLGITREVTLEARGINNLLLKLRIRVSGERFY